MNLNDYITVKLTTAGHGLLMKLVIIENEYFSQDEFAGKWQLWRFMQVFGPHIYMGMPAPLFENNEVTFENSSGSDV